MSSSPGVEPVVVIGCGGHGRELLDIIEAINRTCATFELLGVIDDRGDSEGLLARRNIPMLGDTSLLARIPARYALGIGSPEGRRRLDELARGGSRKPTTLVHPTAVLGSDLRIGPGFVAAAYAQVTTNVSIGRHVHLNIGATVSHDCVLGDFTTLSPGVHVSGGARIGEGVMLGVGAVVRPGASIGSGTIVGAGAVVVEDLPERVTAVGIPAQPLKQ